MCGGGCKVGREDQDLYIATCREETSGDLRGFVIKGDRRLGYVI